MDRLDRANMMMLSAMMLAAVTIGELRIRGREAETGARTESEAHRSDVLLVARAETYRQPDIMECPIFLLSRYVLRASSRKSIPYLVVGRIRE